jgi:hypothetical protein
VTALVAAPNSPDRAYAIAEGRIWERSDPASPWTTRSAAIPAVDALALDAGDPRRLLAAGANRIFRSDDRGASWQSVGLPLPEANTAVRGIAASGEVIVLATDRGLYRTADGGVRWQRITDNLPAHLEAGPLVRDPVDPATLYAGFAVVPYHELWRRAAEDLTALGRVDLVSLAGGVAFLTLLALGAAAAIRRLRRYYQPSGQNASTTLGP